MRIDLQDSFFSQNLLTTSLSPGKTLKMPPLPGLQPSSAAEPMSLQRHPPPLVLPSPPGRSASGPGDNPRMPPAHLLEGVRPGTPCPGVTNRLSATSLYEGSSFIQALSAAADRPQPPTRPFSRAPHSGLCASSGPASPLPLTPRPPRWTTPSNLRWTRI